jgi:hypothetical protein
MTWLTECEPLINVVRTNKPKGLRGLDQKVRGQVEAFPHGLPQMSSHRRTGGASLIQWYSCGTW